MWREGETIEGTYLMLVRRIPGSDRRQHRPGERVTRDLKRILPTWEIRCQLCGRTRQMRITHPPQLSCGCLRYREFRLKHQKIREAGYAREVALQKLNESVET